MTPVTLIILGLVVGAFAFLVGAMVYVLLRGRPMDAAVLAAFAAEQGATVQPLAEGRPAVRLARPYGEALVGAWRERGPGEGRRAPHVHIRLTLTPPPPPPDFWVQHRVGADLAVPGLRAVASGDAAFDAAYHCLVSEQAADAAGIAGRLAQIVPALKSGKHLHAVYAQGVLSLRFRRNPPDAAGYAALLAKAESFAAALRDIQV
jgi:hypothetical protein